jgi:tRNA pseudouridine32 synthase/23S rRNA pseudouridine746 synthase
MPDDALFRDGVPASRLQLPPGPWATLLDGLAAHFPAIGRERWADRFARGLVLDARRVALAADAPYRAGLELHYWREVVDEPRIAARESVLHADAHLVVADKPHGLPVMPTGRYAAETLIARLVRRLGNPHLVPLHRIDRDTAGIVLFSASPDSRARYHALFHTRRIDKHYEALAPPLPALAFPHVHRSRLVRGEPFFRMAEAPGEPDSETGIDVVERGAALWRYALRPVTGRKHQLRVHMAALGAPIANDPLYPELCAHGDAPLQLLAKAIAFEDPLDGAPRRFESAMALAAQGNPHDRTEAPRHRDAC